LYHSRFLHTRVTYNAKEARLYGTVRS